MGILDEDVERVKAATDIVAIVSATVPLRRVGRRFQGLCPFHAEKTPSFSVNAELGFYKCFGCGVGGDAISFVRESQHLDFAAAVELLAAKAGIPIRYSDAHEGAERGRRKRGVDLVAKAVDWYHERLLTSPDAGAARAYLRERGLDGDIVRKFRIGWAPETWDDLCRTLKLSGDDLELTGLGFTNRRGRPQDFFRSRVLFPIFDANDDALGFGGRVMPGADGPKYRNSPESLVYAKSKVLYGLNWAKRDAVAADEIIVCEGYTDVIGFARVGIDRAVATCGTSLTEEHVRLLRRFARRIVLAFDADNAGQTAADRVYAWEQQFELDVAVAALPAGADPGDLASRDPDGLRQAVARARPFLGFRLDRVLATGAGADPERKARVAREALALIHEHPSDLVRDQYLARVSASLDLPIDRLRRGVVGPKPVTRHGNEPVLRLKDRVTSRLSEVALELAIHRADEVAGLLAPVLFRSPIEREAYEAVVAAGSAEAAMASLDPDGAELVARLVQADSEADAETTCAELCDEVVSARLATIQAEARADGTWRDWIDTIAWLKLRCEELRDPDARTAAVEALVAWLADDEVRRDEGRQL